MRQSRVPMGRWTRRQAQLMEERLWLDTPVGVVECPVFGFGSIRVEAAHGEAHPAAVHLRCARLGAPVRLPPAVSPARPYAVTLNGADVCGQVVWTDVGGALSLG